MNSEEKSRLLEGLTQLAFICGADWEDMHHAAYMLALQDEQFEPVARGILKLMKTHKPQFRGHMPSPAEILEAAGIIGQTAADCAFQTVLKSLDRYTSPAFEDSAITAAMHSAGGLLMLCNATDAQRDFFERRFKAAYEQYSSGHIPEELTKPLRGERGSKFVLVGNDGTTKALEAPQTDPKIKALTGGIG